MLFIVRNISNFIPSIYYSFLIYTFLGLAYIILIVPPRRAAVARYYLVPIIDPFILNILTPYLRAVYTALDLSESY